MCGFVTAALAALGGGGATATGALAGAATAGTGLMKLGTLISVGGSLAQGFMSARAGRDQAEAIAQQQQTEKNLNAVEEMRTRRQMQSQLRQQRSQIAARGIAADSPTALLLGQVGAQEISFQGQAIRQGGQARQQELSAQRRAARARGTQGMLQGVFGAADTLLTAAPEIWPGMLT
jgi:hypothetical protein